MILEAYLKYSNYGFACLPTNKDKMPAIAKGTTWKGGTKDTKEFEKSYGIALACGKKSGNLECIDIDNSFKDAHQVLLNLMQIDGVREIYDKYKIPIESTPRGGFHLIYKCDQIEGNQKLASRMNGKGPETVIETRGEGGYFCCDPTPGYKIVKNSIDTIPIITSEARMILLSACRSFNEVVKPIKKPEEDTDRPGDIYNRSFEAIGEMKAALTSAGWKELSEGIWQRPGKDKGISATLGKAAPGVFYNFSANGDPFESGTGERAGKGYTAFQVVALLKYNGDFNRFAKELHEKQKPPTKVEPKPTKLEGMEASRIDPLSEIIEPPVYCSICESPSMTAGNFSLLNGKAKSGKTFFLGSIVASMLNNSNQLSVLKGSLPGNKRNILYFDTEQSTFHAVRTIQRICTLIEIKSPPNLLAYGLRPYTPAERLQFIEEKISNTIDLGAVAIDGVRDLLTIGINDEAEATSLTSKFLKWTSDYDLHLVLLLHQNKTDLNARGHIGTELLNKAETTLSISKDKSNIFIVSCEYSRDIAFDDFGFIIDNGMIQPAGLPQEEQMKSKNPQYINDQKHFEVLDSIFKNNTKLSYAELQDAIIYGFNNTFGRSASRAFITHYLKKEWIIKERDGHKTFYTYTRAIF